MHLWSRWTVLHIPIITEEVLPFPYPSLNPLLSSFNLVTTDGVAHVLFILVEKHHIVVTLRCSPIKWSQSIFTCQIRASPSIKEEKHHIFVAFICSPMKWSPSTYPC